MSTPQNENKLEGSGGCFREFETSYLNLLDNPDKGEDKNRLLSLNYSGKGKNFTVGASHALTLNEKGSSDARSSDSEVTIVTAVNNRVVETRLSSEGQIRLWANLGQTNIWKPINWTAKLKSGSTLEGLKGWVAGEYAHEKFNFQAKLESKGDQGTFLNEKLTVKVKDFIFGYAIKVSLLNFAFRRNEFFASYRYKDVDLFGYHSHRFEESSTGLSLGKIILGTNFSHKDFKFAGALYYRPWKVESSEKVKIVLGGSRKINDKSEVAARVTSTGNLRVQGNYEINQNASVEVSTQVNFKDPKEFSSKNHLPIPIGLRLNLSYE